MAKGQPRNEPGGRPAPYPPDMAVSAKSGASPLVKASDPAPAHSDYPRTYGHLPVSTPHILHGSLVAINSPGPMNPAVHPQHKDAVRRFSRRH